MRAVVKETQGASAAGGVVDHFCHHRSALIEKQLVADAYLAGWLHENVPQSHLFVEFTKQEHFYLGVGSLLCAVEAGGKHLGVVEDEGVALVEIVEHIAEIQILLVTLRVSERLAILVGLEHLDGLRLFVQHHQSAFVAMERRVQSDQFVAKLEFEL